MAAKEVKMCDMPGYIAALVFHELNLDTVQVKKNSVGRITIITDTEPMNLVYPEGWYYAKGCLRNKHLSTTGRYETLRMVTSDGTLWSTLAKYCTHD